MARLSFRCDQALVDLVDAARGREPREAWLRRMVLVAASAQGHSGSPEWEAARVVEQASRGGGFESRVPAVESRAPAEQPVSRVEAFRRATQRR